MEERGSGKKRGFAAMDRERQRAIASEGGRAAHQKGTAHEFSPEEAREAGRKGGVAVSGNRAHMSAIGRKGAEARRAANPPTSGNVGGGRRSAPDESTDDSPSRHRDR
ncbi:MAG: stress-induced protein [Gemmatimonadota bacterium]|nr:stress-induced protein [Gemmatimonadota bacterium]